LVRWYRWSAERPPPHRPIATAGYSLRELPFGPYILSVHSRGYFKSRGRTVQLTTSKISIPEIQLARARKTPVLTPAVVEEPEPR
jgi:hypothetical protein